jgi:hypothetical protein
MSDGVYWLEQSVQDFFSNCNWLGNPVVESSNGKTPKEVSNLQDLTISVGEFFKLFPWDGTPIIGALPTPTPTPVFSEVDTQDVTLEDLLNIF